MFTSIINRPKTEKTVYQKLANLKKDNENKEKEEE